MHDQTFGAPRDRMATLSSYQRIRARHLASFAWQPLDSIPLGVRIPRQAAAPGSPDSSADTGQVDSGTAYAETFANFDHLLQTQLAALGDTARVESDLIPTVMVDCGNALPASMFGAEILTVDGGQPWIRPCIADIGDVDKLREPDLSAGLMPLVVEAIRYFQARVPAGVWICPPFEQGPLTMALLLRGPALYTDLHESPGQVHKLLRLCTDTFIKIQTYFKEVLGEPLGEHVSWKGTVVPGMRVADDCAVNLSPAALEEFDIPYLKEIARAFGGGVLVHYCSIPTAPGNHVLVAFSRHPEILGVDSQPNVLPYFWQHLPRLEGTVTPVTTVDATTDEEFRAQAIPFWQHLRRRTGVILQTTAPDVEAARRRLAIWAELAEEHRDAIK